MNGFTEAFGLELFEVRETVRAAARPRAFVRPAAADSPAWAALEAIEAEHRALLEAPDEALRDFPDLDDRFHRLIHGASHNRFIIDFYDVISLIFHYHYQWSKKNEIERNRSRARRASRLHRRPPLGTRSSTPSSTAASISPRRAYAAAGDQRCISASSRPRPGAAAGGSHDAGLVEDAAGRAAGEDHVADLVFALDLGERCGEDVVDIGLRTTSTPSMSPTTRSPGMTRQPFLNSIGQRIVDDAAAQRAGPAQRRRPRTAGSRAA